ncbi:MAG: VWA domain-containing protein [Chitinophagales bacterium]|nr:VWA domain-containing protein [Bacteroidota bacterium]MCB9042772.1 VWA domain-containing protein [Chitinophagales bacterium]
MRQHILFFLLIFFVQQSARAQVKIPQNVLDMNECYNLTIEAINEAAHCINSAHTPLQNFNFEINQLAKAYQAEANTKKQAEILNKAPKLSLFKEINNPNFFLPQCAKMAPTPFISIEKQHQAALAKADKVPPGYRQRLQELMKKSRILLKQYEELLQKIDQQTQNPSYLKEENLASTYALLDKYSLLCFDYSVVMDKLFKVMLESNGQYLLPGMEKMHAITYNAHQLLLAMRRNDKNETAYFKKNVDNGISNDNSENEALLKESDEFSFDETKIQAIIAQAKQISLIADNFLTNKTPWQNGNQNNLYNEVGGAMYFGEKIVEHFNHNQKGIVWCFNEFVKLSNFDLLFQPEETIWFKTVYLEKPELKIDEAAILESLKNAMENDNLPPPPPVKPPPSLEGAATNNLIFLLDVSHSMNVEEKMPLLQESFKFLVDLLRPEDKVAIVTYAGNAKVILNSTSGKEKQELKEAISELRFSGKTDGYNGMKLAFEECDKNFIPDGNNRIIIATDGKFIIDSKLEKLIKKYARKGIALSAFQFGFGESPIITDRLTSLSQIGSGNFYHVTNSEEGHDSILQEAKAIQKK